MAVSRPEPEDAGGRAGISLGDFYRGGGHKSGGPHFLKVGAPTFDKSGGKILPGGGPHFFKKSVKIVKNTQKSPKIAKNRQKLPKNTQFLPFWDQFLPVDLFFFFFLGRRTDFAKKVGAPTFKVGEKKWGRQSYRGGGEKSGGNFPTGGGAKSSGGGPPPPPPPSRENPGRVL